RIRDCRSRPETSRPGRFDGNPTKWRLESTNCRFGSGSRNPAIGAASCAQNPERRRLDGTPGTRRNASCVCRNVEKEEYLELYQLGHSAGQPKLRLRLVLLSRRHALGRTRYLASIVNAENRRSKWFSFHCPMFQKQLPNTGFLSVNILCFAVRETVKKKLSAKIFEFKKVDLLAVS